MRGKSECGDSLLAYEAMTDTWSKPDWECEGVRLYCGDCLKLLPQLPAGIVDGVVSDPPYGGSYDTDYTRFSGGLSPNRNWGNGIVGDDKPFDPAPWLAFEQVCLWGYQHWAHRVPLGTILVWCKKRDTQLGTFLSDAELAWTNKGRGCYVCQHTWHGFDRDSERGKVLHPTQKPVALMRWCIERLGGASIILDPFMGSGTTGVACVQTGREFVGIEIEPKYFDIAVTRIDQERRQGRMDFG